MRQIIHLKIIVQGLKEDVTVQHIVGATLNL